MSKITITIAHQKEQKKKFAKKKSFDFPIYSFSVCYTIDYSVKIENYSIDYLVQTQTDLYELKLYCSLRTALVRTKYFCAWRASAFEFETA